MSCQVGPLERHIGRMANPFSTALTRWFCGMGHRRQADVRALDVRLSESIYESAEFGVPSPGLVVPAGRRPAGRRIPEGRLTPRLHAMPRWVRVWYRTPFIDRYAYSWMWWRGGWDVLVPRRFAATAASGRHPRTPPPDAHAKSHVGRIRRLLQRVHGGETRIARSMSVARCRVSVVATWSEFRSSAPDLADIVRHGFAVRNHATMATIRKDGAPRISSRGVDFSDDGEVYLGMMAGARRAADLRRDPRVAVHYPTVDPSDAIPPRGSVTARWLPTRSRSNHTGSVWTSTTSYTRRSPRTASSWRSRAGSPSLAYA